MALQRLLCPCNRCKRGILRQERIVEDHLEQWGRWDDTIVERQILEFANTRRIDASLVSPHNRRRSSNVSSSSVTDFDVGQSSASSQPDQTMEQNSYQTDVDMDDMIDAFLDINNGDEDGDEGDNTEGPTVDPVVERLRQLASTPLFEGSRSTILRTCLALLNLQTIYG